MAAIVGGVLLVLIRLQSAILQPEDIRDTLRALPSAPLILVVVLALVLVVPVVPAIIFQIGSGLAFGPVWGLAYALGADLLGAALGFELARRWGLRVLGRWISPARIEGVERLARRVTLKSLILLRLLPGPAYPLVSFAAGMSGMGFGRYLLASFIGVLPSLALLVLAGDVATGSPLIGVAIVLLLVAGLFLIGRLMNQSSRDET